MLVMMTRQVFDSLDHDSLGRVCMEPTFLKIRGKDPQFKAQVYAQLPPGQQALFMFRVLYDHAHHSIAEFYCWTALLLEQPDTWEEIRKGLFYFGDEAMWKLLEEMKGVLEAKNLRIGAEMCDVSFKDLDNDPELFASVSRLFAMFQELAALSLQRIGTSIRSNPGEFVQIAE